MSQYIINSDYASLVAIDQHARTSTLKAIDLDTGVTKTRRLDDCPSADQMAEWALSWMTPPIRFAYESGPCGFDLARKMRAAGHACDIIAVTSIPGSTEDKTLKDNRRDAERLLSEMVNPSSKIKAIWVPDKESEACRDLVRAYYDSTAATKRSKQQLAGFLLRHGVVWNQRTIRGTLRATWTKPYIAWLSSIKMNEPADTAALDFYIKTATENLDRDKKLSVICSEYAETPRWKPYIDALARLKGVEMLTALTFAATIGDFERFSSGRAVSAYFGLTPSRHSSGEKANKNGHITKSGDSTCRHAIIEALSCIPNLTSGTKKPAPGRLTSVQVEAEALKCNTRNVERYRHLIKAGKPANVAKTAVASELVRDMWIIGRMVQRELADTR